MPGAGLGPALLSQEPQALSCLGLLSFYGGLTIRKAMVALTVRPLPDAASMPKNNLAYIAGAAPATKAVVVVGGIHDTYGHFSAWTPALDAPDTLVVGFDHDHQSSTMTEASEELAHAISALREHGVEEVTVVAHSMGGLVSKAALDIMVESGAAEKFEQIDLHALGTPWGGYALASLPGSSFFGTMFGYPMGGEMSPGSDFMKGLSAVDWPENMSFNVYQGSSDNVSLPSVLATHERYDATTSKADVLITIEGFGHTDYVRAGADVLQAGKDLEPSESGPARYTAEADMEMD